MFAAAVAGVTHLIENPTARAMVGKVAYEYWIQMQRRRKIESDKKDDKSWRQLPILHLFTKYKYALPQSFFQSIYLM